MSGALVALAEHASGLTSIQHVVLKTLCAGASDDGRGAVLDTRAVAQLARRHRVRGGDVWKAVHQIRKLGLIRKTGGASGRMIVAVDTAALVIWVDGGQP